MADIYLTIDITHGNAAKALSAVHALDPRDLGPDFTATGRGWWHKPPDRVRSVVSRLLSRMGCSGRIGIGQPVVWTGFAARHDHSGEFGAMTCDVCKADHGAEG